MKRIFFLILLAVMSTGIYAQTDDKGYKEGAWVLNGVTGGEEGFKVYMNKLVGELKSTMTMCGAASLKDISRDMIWLGK